jgi:hypothetical protein
MEGAEGHGNVEATVDDLPAGFRVDCLLDLRKRSVLSKQMSWHGRVRSR